VTVREVDCFVFSLSTAGIGAAPAALATIAISVGNATTRSSQLSAQVLSLQVYKVCHITHASSRYCLTALSLANLPVVSSALRSARLQELQRSQQTTTYPHTLIDLANPPCEGTPYGLRPMAFSRLRFLLRHCGESILAWFGTREGFLQF
jgi:hypothetical protein